MGDNNDLDTPPGRVYTPLPGPHGDLDDTSKYGDDYTGSGCGDIFFGLLLAILALIALGYIQVHLP